jgi:hypothetical protein
MYFGFTILFIELLAIISGVAQNGQLSEVTFGASVVDAPHSPHFTVLICCSSEVCTFSERNVSKSISSAFAFQLQFHYQYRSTDI